MRRLIAALALCLAGPAQAYDLALVIGNGRYHNLPDVAEGGDVGTLIERLRRAGFEVVAETGATQAEAREAVERFVDRAAGADRLLVVLQGNFLRTEQDFYLLPKGSREPSIDALPRRSLPVSTLMPVLASKPRERAVMVLGSGGQRGAASPYLDRGLVSLPEDPGFVMVGGAASVVGDFARDRLAVPGESFGARDLRRLNVAVEGLTDPPMTFIPGDRELRDPPPRRDREADRRGAARQAEDDYWEAIRDLDTERGYTAYLDRHPEGAHSEEAVRRLDALRRDPERRARAGEDALGLDREERRRVQAGLSVLGFDPRGIDGVFGPGTRSALRAWQRAQGLEPTGFLGADQLARLSDQAGRRAAALEAEAALERAETRRLDEEWWSRTGAQGTAEGLDAYLERFPDGVHAEAARERLAALERRAREGAALADARAWDEARAEDRPRAYRRYIESNPDGAFVEAARARLRELRARRRDGGGAEAAEDGLGLTPVTRGLVEGRLEVFGFEPGTVDGVFDGDTRRAIRRYQRSRGLEPTGFLDRDSVARILADSILR